MTRFRNAAQLGALLLFFTASIMPSAWGNPPLRVGLTGKYPPFNYFNQKGELTGFDVEVARKVCEFLDRPCEFKTLQWDGILASLLGGQIDVIIGSMAITPERQEKAVFSDPYYESGAQLFVRDAREDPHRPGFRIGVTLGTTYETFVRKTFPAAEVRTYRGDPAIFRDLHEKRLDAMVTDKLAGAHLNQKFSGNLTLLGEPFYLERIGIPIARGSQNERLLPKINQAVHTIRTSPEYEEWMSRYFDLKPSSQFSWENQAGSIGSLLLRGLWATIKVSFSGIAFGCVLAMILSALLIGRRSPWGPGGLPVPLRKAVVFFVDFIRSTPFLVQLFAVYFGLPGLGIRLHAWDAAVVTIALHSSAYLSEVIKGAYQSIPMGQHHAGAVLGLTRTQTLKEIILPQMLPVLSAPVLNTVVAMIKDSAIVSVISVYELTMQAQQLISATFRPMEFYLLAAGLYFLITYPLLILGRLQEKKFRKRGLLHSA